MLHGGNEDVTTRASGLSLGLACSRLSVNRAAVSIAPLIVLTFPLLGLEEQETIAIIDNLGSANISGSLLLLRRITS